MRGRRAMQMLDDYIANVGLMDDGQGGEMRKCVVCGKRATGSFALEIIHYHYYADEDDYGASDSLWTYDEAFVCDEHDTYSAVQIYPKLIIRKDVVEG